MILIRESIINFKNSKTAIPILITLIIITHSIPVILQAWTPDKEPDYYLEILPSVQKCNILQYPVTESNTLLNNGTVIDNGYTHQARDPLKWWLNCFSYKETGTPKLIPIFFNLALMPLVYLIAVKLTNNKLIGLLSFCAFILNPLYSQWVSSGTYDQVWSFFLILSFYLIYRFKFTTYPILSFCISIAAKALGFMYLPVLLYSYYKTKEKHLSKNVIICFIVIAVIFSSAVILLSPGIIGGKIGFYPDHFKDAIYGNVTMLLPELVILVMFVYVSMVYKPKVSQYSKKIPLLWILNALLTTPIIYLFTNQFQFVYRFIPLAVFMSIFIAITITDLFNYILEKKMSKTNHT